MDANVVALREQLAALQLLLQQQAAQTAAQATQLATLLQAQQQPVVVPGPFALTPAEAQQDVIDLATTAGIKLQKQIVTPLSTLFDGSPNKLATFLTTVFDRATSCNWNQSLLKVNNQAQINPQDLNLITKHRMLSLANV
jgi:hypothetical protein